MSPIITILFAIYAALVATVVTGLTAIFLRMLTLTKHQGVLQGNLEGIQQQLAQFNGELTRTSEELARLDTTVGREIGRLDTKIDNRIDRLDNKVDNLREEMQRNNEALREEMRLQREEMRRNNEALRGEMRLQREEMQRNTDALREEMQRNTNRIIQVLISHSHQDGSPPVFNVPPEAEPVAADN
jgi:DNA repair exonuclease SbcCD ATPase subunit